MRSFLTCALLPLFILMTSPAGAQEETPADTQEEAPADETQSDEEILETVPVDDEAGTDSEPPPEDDDGAVSYSSIGLSRVSADFNNLKEAINLDFGIGIRVPTINWISAEINFSTTIIPGENKGAASGGAAGTECPILDPFCTPTGGSGGQPGTRSSNDLQMNNIGVFAVLRSQGQFYATGKIGYRFINSSIEEIQEGGDKTGTAYGAGGGYRWGRSLSGVEIMYTKYSDQIDYLGFNIAYGFGGRNR